MYQWIVFLHILGALLFFLAHGASVFMALRLRRETNPDRIRALLDLSTAAMPAMVVGLLLLVVSGIIAGFMGNWWSQGWIGLSLLLMIVLTVWMGYYARQHYIPIRAALGMEYRGQPGAATPATAEEIQALIQAANPVLLTAVGFGLSAVILWLMVFKPF